MAKYVEKVRLGRILITPGASEVLSQAQMQDILRRHVQGDWGDLCQADKRANDLALVEGERILSAYILPSAQKVWVITEWDRCSTTILLPFEY